MSDDGNIPDTGDNPPRFSCGHDHSAPGTGDACDKPKKGFFTRFTSDAPEPAAAGGATEPPHPSASSGTHFHGDTPCSHTHAPSSSLHEPPIPKSKSVTALWVAGIAAVVGIGAYLINEYGKKPNKKSPVEKQPDAWQQRVSATKSENQRI